MDNDIQTMLNAFVVDKTQEMLELINDDGASITHTPTQTTGPPPQTTMDFDQASIARWDKAAAATPDGGVGFAMTDATLAEIEKLFTLLDVDKSGTITLSDFQLQAAADGVEGERSDSGGSSLADSRFTQLLYYFDQDGDRCVLVCAV